MSWRFGIAVVAALCLSLPGLARAQDLQLTQTTAPYSGSTAHAKAEFTVRCEVKNSGTKGLTSGFEIHYHYCPKAATKDCVKLGATVVTDKLGANTAKTYTSGKLVLPASVVYGAGQLRFVVDAKSQISETNEKNNETYDAIAVTTAPDLLVLASTVPGTGSTAAKGATFAGKYSIQVGAKTSRLTTDFAVTYYYCPKATTAACVSLGTETVKKDLNAGESHSYTSINLTIPQTAQNGTRYIRAFVDSAGAVTESDETNNNDYDDITVSAIPSDLKVLSFTAPFTGSTNAAGAAFTVRVDVMNDSSNAFSDDFEIHYFYCPKAAATGCTLFGTTKVPDDFPAKQKRSYTSATLKLPGSVLFGTGHVRVLLDATNKVLESDETNNDKYSAITITTRPDLTVAASTVPSSGSTAAGGSTFTGKYTILNSAGTSRLTDDFTIKYEYCTDSTGATCTLLGQETVTQDLDSNGSHIHTSKTLTIPAGVQNGTRYVRATLDSSKAVTESNENNNVDYDDILVSAVPSDLQILALTIPYAGSTNFAGAKFSAYFQLKNASKNGFTGDFEVYFYYCKTKGKTGCVKFGNKKITDNFAANQTRSYVSTALTLPDSVTLGVGYVRMFADATGVLTESNKTNNEAYAAINVTTLPDLTVTAGTVPNSAGKLIPGSSYTGQFTVHNGKSTSRLTTNFEVTYFDCPGKAITGCVQVGKQTLTKDLDAGASYSYTSTTLTVPATAKYGTRYVRALVDSGDAVKESDEKNNDTYGELTLTGPPDLHISSMTTKKSGADVTFTVKVCNKGDTTKTGFKVDLYYDRSSAPLCGGAANHSWSIAGLKKSACETKTLLYTVKKPGSYVAWVMADGACSVLESDEKNNSASSSYSHTVSDLKFISFKVPYVGSTTYAGAQFTLQFQLQNASSNGFTTDFDVYFYYCTTKGKTSCVQFGSKKVTDNFTANQIHSWITTPLTLPNSVLLGTGYVRLFADAKNVLTESDETNNDAYASITVTTKPDLTIAADKVPNSTGALVAGSAFTGQFTIKNTKSTSRLTKAFDVTYWDCPAKATTGCVIIGKQTITKALDAGASYTYTSTTLTVPVAAKLGARYVRAMVDSGKAVSETDETNNDTYGTIQLTGPPDLIISSITTTKSGANITFEVKVCNKGDAIKQGFSVALHTNRSGAPLCGAKGDYTWALTGLDKSTCVTKTQLHTIKKPGVYLAWAMADSACAILEGDETNNALSKAYAHGVDAGVDMALEAGSPDGGCTDGGCPDAKTPDAKQPCGEAGCTDAVLADAKLADAKLADAKTPDAKQACGEAGCPDAPVQLDLGPDWTPHNEGLVTDTSNLVPSRPDEEGCGCEVGAAGGGRAVWLVLLASLLLLLRRRRT